MILELLRLFGLLGMYQSMRSGCAPKFPAIRHLDEDELLYRQRSPRRQSPFIHLRCNWDITLY